MNERAIIELEQMYMMLSEEKKKAIDEAIKALQAQADGDIITALCSLPKIISEDGQDYVQLADVLETVRRFKPQTDGDLISRQAVLEAIDVKAWEFCDYLISKNRNDEQKPVSHFADNLRECVREELPSVKQEPCEDTISRQAVLEKAVYTETEEGWCGYTVDVDYIKSLPSVKPQKSRTELKFCDRNICQKNEYNGIGCDECEVTKSQEPCEDAISRQAVLEYIEGSEAELGHRSENELVCQYIKELPPVKPQEPKAEKVIKMRDTTPEERESIDKYIKSISKPTGINFWDLDDNDDCISRKAVLSLLADHFDNVFDMVKELPSVAIPSAEPYKGMTNGEVITKILKDAEWAELTSDFALLQEDTIHIKVGSYWWNSQYDPQESEDGE